MLDPVQQLFGQYANYSYGANYDESKPIPMMTAKDGQAALYQSQSQLVNNLFSETPVGYDIFSPSFFYNAVTTWALSKSDPTAFYISPEDAGGLGWQIQSNMAAQLFGSMTPTQSSGVDILGSLYASNGMVSLLNPAPTYTFQAEA